MCILATVTLVKEEVVPVVTVLMDPGVILSVVLRLQDRHANFLA